MCGTSACRAFEKALPDSNIFYAVKANPCPAVVRTIIGKSWGQGAQHSQALHSLFMHLPGMKVAAHAHGAPGIKDAIRAGILTDICDALAAGLRIDVTGAPFGSDFRLTDADGRPRSLADFRGKVVLIDFWTYSCINCLRTLPHVQAWDRMYRKDGLVIVGVHTPEFGFEKDPENVAAAVARAWMSMTPRRARPWSRPSSPSTAPCMCW